MACRRRGGQYNTGKEEFYCSVWGFRERLRAKPTDPAAPITSQSNAGRPRANHGTSPCRITSVVRQSQNGRLPGTPFEASLL